MKPWIQLALLVTAALSACSPSPIPTTKAWHQTEGLGSEPVSLPSCDLKRVRKLKVGNRLVDVERLVDYPAVHFYHNADFMTLHASDPKVKDHYWEVALRYKKLLTISDISFKRIAHEPFGIQ